MPTTIAELLKELELIEQEVEKAKAQLYRLEGAAGYIRGKIKGLQEAEMKALEGTAEANP